MRRVLRAYADRDEAGLGEALREALRALEDDHGSGRNGGGA